MRPTVLLVLFAPIAAAPAVLAQTLSASRPAPAQYLSPPPARVSPAPALSAPGSSATTAGAGASALADQAAPAPAAVRPGSGFHYRQTLEQRFAEANETKDGKLTQPQAYAARWSYVVRNFDSIDTTHSGVVTIEEIRKFAAERRAERAQQQQQDPQAPQRPTVRTAVPSG